MRIIGLEKTKPRITWLLKIVHELSASLCPKSLLEMNNLRTHPRPIAPHFAFGWEDEFLCAY
jgi:hypothetical protein